MYTLRASFPSNEQLVENGIRKISLPCTAELEPSELLGPSYYPLLRVPVASGLKEDNRVSTRHLDTSDKP